MCSMGKKLFKAIYLASKFILFKNNIYFFIYKKKIPCFGYFQSKMLMNMIPFVSDHPGSGADVTQPSANVQEVP